LSESLLKFPLVEVAQESELNPTIIIKTKQGRFLQTIKAFLIVLIFITALLLLFSG
jgi:hypothetical protein